MIHDALFLLRWGLCRCYTMRHSIADTIEVYLNIPNPLPVRKKSGFLSACGRWGIGLLVSFSAVWCVSQFFSTTLYNWDWDPVLQDYVISPGTLHRHRKEGWASTRIGRHGVYAIADIESVHESKVVFWGDSFVQGFQVNDDEKMAQQFTRLWNQDSRTPLVGVGIGTGERSCADYYFLLPRYRDILRPVRCHVIVLHDLTDTFPDRSTTRFRFLSKPQFHMQADAPTPPVNNPGLIALAQRFGLDAFFRLAFEAKTKMKDLRFRPGPIARVEMAEVEPSRESVEFYRDAWDYLLAELKRQADAPLLFVYCPAVPTLDRGRIVTTDPDGDLFREFQAICTKQGIDTVDLTERLFVFFQKTGRFSRGFMNSNPLEGHFNSDGHRLVAEAVCHYLEKKQHAIHTN